MATEMHQDDPHLMSEKKSKKSGLGLKRFFKQGKQDVPVASTQTVSASGEPPGIPLETEATPEQSAVQPDQVKQAPDVNKPWPPDPRTEKELSRKPVKELQSDTNLDERGVVGMGDSTPGSPQQRNSYGVRGQTSAAEATQQPEASEVIVYRASAVTPTQLPAKSRIRLDSDPNDLPSWIIHADKFDMDGELTFEQVLQKNFRDKFPSIPNNPIVDSHQEKVAKYLIQRSDTILTTMIDGLRAMHKEDLRRQESRLKAEAKKRIQDESEPNGKGYSDKDFHSVFEADGLSNEPRSWLDDHGNQMDTSRGYTNKISQLEQELARKDEELVELKGRSNGAHVSSQGPSFETQKIARLEGQLKQLRAQVDTHKSDAEEAQRSLAVVKEEHAVKIKEQDDWIQSLQHSNVNAMNQRQQDHQDKIDVMQQRLDLLSEKLSQADQTRMEGQRQAETALRQDLQEKYTNNALNARHAHDMAMKAANEEHRNQLLAASEQNRIDKLAHQTAMTELRREHEGKLAELVHDHSVVTYRYQNAAKIANDEYEELKKTCEDNLTLFRQRLQKGKEDSDQQIAQLRSQHELEKKRVGESFQQHIESLSNDHKDELQVLQANLARSQAEHTSTLTSLQQTHAAEKSQITQTLEAKLAAIEKTLSNTVTTLETTEQAFEDTEEALAESKEKLNSTIERLRVTTASLESTKQELESTRQSHILAMEDLKQTNAREKAELLELHKVKEKQFIAKRKEDRQSLQQQLQELRESLLARDEKMYVDTIFYPPDLPRKSDDKLKADFQVVQRMVEEIGGAWEAWRADQDRWPKQLLSKAVSQHGERAPKKAILQDIIWKQLFKFIFASPFRIFGEEGQRMDAEWAQQCGGAMPSEDNVYYAWPLPGVKAERWRYMTIAGCTDTLKAKISQQDPRSRLKKGFIDCTNELTARMKDELAAVANLNDDQKKVIEKLTTKAARMWLDFELHRCRIVIRLTAHVEDRTWLTVLPSLSRYGDVDGKDLESLTTIPGCSGGSLKIG